MEVEYTAAETPCPDVCRLRIPGSTDPAAAGGPRDAVAEIRRLSAGGTDVVDAARHAFDRLLETPGGLRTTEQAHSQALYLATAAGRLEDLLRRLEDARASLLDDRSRFVNLLASAKLCLVLDRPAAVADYAAWAADVAVDPRDGERARRLKRAACWLAAPEDQPRVSQWRLRALHPLLPRLVAWCLECNDQSLVQAERAPALRRALRSARPLLRVATGVAEDPAGPQPLLRQALAGWATGVGLALLGDDGGPGDAAIAFLVAACRLEPDSVATVGNALAMAVARAGAAADESRVRTAAERVVAALPAADPGSTFVADVLAAWREDGQWRRTTLWDDPLDIARVLRRASGERPRPSLETAFPDLAHRLTGIPADTAELIEACVLDRQLLLPDEAPFRGPAWFECGVAHQQYEDGRKARDAAEAYHRFEEAWRREPTNRIAVQGLIIGLVRRLGQKPGRHHLLNQLALVLDQIADNQVEAALAYASLAHLAEEANHRREQRTHLERAVDALQRRVDREPWTRARNAQIALLLELGRLGPAGAAALAEARMYLPGSEPSRRYALLAVTLWERDGEAEAGADLEAARTLVTSRPLSTREAVQYAVGIRRLIALRDLELDEDVLQDLWWACRGNEDEVVQFLEKQGGRAIDPRPHYLDFLRRRRPAPAPDERGLPRLRLAAAEVLSRDPLHELPISTSGLTEAHLREFFATLRETARSTRTDVAATERFVVAVQDALAALFELRQTRQSGAELYACRLANASAALDLVRRTADAFHEPVSGVTRLLSRHLERSLEEPMKSAYLGQKGRRLVPSRLGTSLGGWWKGVCEAAGPLDFFHQHQLYRCPTQAAPMAWWETHTVHGEPVRTAVLELKTALELHANRLREIDSQFRAYRDRQPGPTGFGLGDELDGCCAILRAALDQSAGPGQVSAVGGALERLGRSLRRLDMARLTDLPDLLYDPALPTGTYLLPRAEELLGHWRENAGAEPFLRAVFEVHDDAGHEVLCLACLDAGSDPVSDVVRLRGMKPFADLVEALGGQFHLWVARPHGPSACRLEHGDDCSGSEYVERMVDRLRDLAATTLHIQQGQIGAWSKVLESGLRSRGSAALAFAILPRVGE
jgi:hypothetical protein